MVWNTLTKQAWFCFKIFMSWKYSGEKLFSALKLSAERKIKSFIILDVKGHSTGLSLHFQKKLNACYAWWFLVSEMHCDEKNERIVFSIEVSTKIPSFILSVERSIRENILLKTLKVKLKCWFWFWSIEVQLLFLCEI